MDFKDSVDGTGAPEDNNFDIVDDSCSLIVPNRGPEWTSIAGEIGETVYIIGRKVRADVKLKINPVISGVPLQLELYSGGDLDFTPAGTADHTVTLTFDSAGYATHTFTTHTKKLSDVLDRKEYTITWEGCASGNEVKQHIYTLYGVPVDNWNRTAPPSDPQHTHLKYLLGPQVGGEGEWCNEKSTLKEIAVDSIPYAVQQGIIRDGAFPPGGGASCGNPWKVVTTVTGGVCEDWAELMKQALLVAGVPGAKLRRKSVVSSMISRPSWFGAGPKNLIKAFREAGSTGIWMNEGVCGVNTSDKGWRYYDLAGSDEIGKGGWATPNDSSDNNLWYEPTPSNHGPVIFEIVEEVYGTWTPQATPPYETTAIKNEYPKLLELGTVAKAGDDFTINYRTEGVKDVGVKVQMKLFKWEGAAWVHKQEKAKSHRPKMG